MRFDFITILSKKKKKKRVDLSLHKDIYEFMYNKLCVIVVYCNLKVYACLDDPNLCRRSYNNNNNNNNNKSNLYSAIQH